MRRWVTTKEAALLLGISEDTVKRRLKAGELNARQETMPRGFRWLVEVEVEADTVEPPEPGPSDGELAALRELIDVLRCNQDRFWEQLAMRDREISELHILLQRALEPSRRAIAEPWHSPRTSRRTSVVAATTQLVDSIRQSERWKRFWGVR